MERGEREREFAFIIYSYLHLLPKKGFQVAKRHGAQIVPDSVLGAMLTLAP